MRRPPVTSLSSAQRPVSSSASSQRASWAGNSLLPRVARPLMTAERVGGFIPPPKGEGGERSEPGGDLLNVFSLPHPPASRAPSPCGGGIGAGHISATVSDRSPT